MANNRRRPAMPPIPSKQWRPLPRENQPSNPQRHQEELPSGGTTPWFLRFATYVGPGLVVTVLLVVPSMLELFATRFDLDRAFLLAQVVPPTELGIRMLPLLAPIALAVLVAAWITWVTLLRRRWLVVEQVRLMRKGGRMFAQPVDVKGRRRMLGLLLAATMVFAALFLALDGRVPTGIRLVAPLVLIFFAAVLMARQLDGSVPDVVPVGPRITIAMLGVGSFLFGVTLPAVVDPFPCGVVQFKGAVGARTEPDPAELRNIVSVEKDGVWSISDTGDLSFTSAIPLRVTACKTRD